MAKKKVSGRGKKTCPECGASVGVRTITCGCGHEFGMKAKVVKRGRSAAQSSLRDSLVAEKQRIEEALENREVLEERLAKINALLETWEE